MFCTKTEKISLCFVYGFLRIFFGWGEVFSFSMENWKKFYKHFILFFCYSTIKQIKL